MKHKFDDFTRELAFGIGHGFCMCSPDCTERANELHHKLSNTKTNQKLFPLFLQSIFNACPINHGCHMTKPLPRIKKQEAEAYEKYLERLFYAN